MSTILKTFDEPIYRELLAATLPRVIHTEAENERFISALEALHDRGRLTPEEERLSELLTLLVENFESQHYQLKSATRLEVLRELMIANGLKQSDLIDAEPKPAGQVP